MGRSDLLVPTTAGSLIRGWLFLSHAETQRPPSCKFHHLSRAGLEGREGHGDEVLFRSVLSITRKQHFKLSALRAVIFVIMLVLAWVSLFIFVECMNLFVWHEWFFSGINRG